MTTRERWIVYPLLFLSLGIALRDKVIPPMHTTSFNVTAHEIEADSIRCNKLRAVEAECGSMAAEKVRWKEQVRWKEADIEAGAVRLGPRLPDKPAPKPHPVKTDMPN